ncbi:MAG: hypothetical protein EZS28_050466 [Streblomastix strix]|uniref:Uncharacterized protein n=1 Tax=Streblomastix strix TaxID=222440 RepID=A0A5J4T6X5_9EUKA|nr:MAG: hypothetical protein EZS28_050466 [Streblomastix strix]
MENKEIKEQKKPRKKYIKKVKPAAGGGRAGQVKPQVEPQVETATEPVVEPTTEPSVEPNVKAPKQGRPRKYQTEEEAKEKARLQRKQFKMETERKIKIVLSKEDLIIILEIIEGGPKEQTDDISN